MTAQTVAQQLGVSEATLRRLRAKAGISARSKASGYTAQEIEQLRSMMNAKLEHDAQNSAHRKQKRERNHERHTAQDSAQEKQKNERHEHAELQARIARLEAQLADQQADMQRLIIWGTKAALAIRELWRRMPDYAPGATPGEFPAITLDAIGREELAIQREEGRKTRAFFERLDSQQRA